jgi:hypothetical protein
MEIVLERVGMLNISVFPVLQIPNLEVWFQRPKDIVRKLQSGVLK